MIDNAGTTLDAATQDAFNAALAELEKRRQAGTLTPAEKTAYEALLKKATTSTSPVLSTTQKGTITTTVLPAVKGEKVTPTPTIITDITKDTNSTNVINALNNMVSGSAGTTVDAATQKAFNDAITELEKRQLAGTLTTAEKTALATLKQKASVSPITSLSPNATSINNAIKDANSTNVITILNNMIDNAGSSIDPITQKAFNGALAELEKRRQAGMLTPEEKTLYQTLLAKVTSPQSTVLSAAQKTTITTIIIPAASGQSVKPTATTINNLVNDPNPMNIINALNNMIAGAGSTVDQATQNAFNNALIELERKRQAGKLTPAEKVAFAKLLAIAATSPILSSKQQETIKNTILPASTGRPSISVPSGARSTTVTPTTTTAKFDKFMANLKGQMTFRSKLTELRSLIDYAKGINCTADQQNLYAKTLNQLYNECPINDRDALKLFTQLINQSMQTTLLSEKQVAWVNSSVMPRLQKK